MSALRKVQEAARPISMQIESLKMFCDLAETASFTKAAEMSNVTQSAISQQIGSLERKFKSLLVERSKKQFGLTREGQVVYEYGKQILATHDALHSRFQEIKSIVSGTIRLATIYSIGLHDLPPYLKTFLKAFPTVNMHVAYRHASQVYADVLSNVVDLGLVAYPNRDPQLKIVALRDEPLVLICHPSHPFANAASLKLADLQGQKFIHFEAGIPTRRAIDRCLKEAHVTVQTTMEFDNIETVKRAVEVEAGIAIVPRPTVTQEVSKKTLAEVKLEGEDLFRPLAAIYKKSKILSPALKELLTVLKG